MFLRPRPRGLFHVMQHDLLTDEDSRVYAVNCQVEDAALHCGALYLEPQIPDQFIRLAYDGGSIEVELPTELVGQMTAMMAWDTTLLIRHHV